MFNQNKRRRDEQEGDIQVFHNGRWIFSQLLNEHLNICVKQNDDEYLDKHIERMIKIYVEELEDKVESLEDKVESLERDLNKINSYLF